MGWLWLHNVLGVWVHILPELVRAVFINSSGVVRVPVHVVVDDMPDLGDLNGKWSSGGSRLMVCAEQEGCGRCCCCCYCCRHLSASVYGDSGVSHFDELY